MPQICIEVFAIGDELCYGRIYDTNSFWIADQVTQLGARVQRITCIPDNLDVICRSLQEALNRNPAYIILTGGLGPTSDDLTIEAFSKLFNLEMTVNGEVLKAMAERRKVPVEHLPPNLIRMARSLKGAECLPNPVGWAAVTIVQNGDTTVAALPGPPKEAKACFSEYLAKRIRERTRLESESKRVYAKMYESQVSPLADEIMKEIPGVYLKPLISEFQSDTGLPVDIIAFATNKEACDIKMEKTIKRLEELVIKKGGALTV